MSPAVLGPSFVPPVVAVLPALQNTDPLDGDWHRSFRCMASTVNVRIGAPAESADEAFADVEALFRAVEAQCTRFDPDSDLMRANAAGRDWAGVGEHCFGSIAAAAEAHSMTGGLFDPRVLRTLSELGYDRTVPFAAGDIELTGHIGSTPTLRALWSPQLDSEQRRVSIGPEPIDLGGIGKGLAVRWAVQAIADRCPSFLIEAGGDCYLAGSGPDGDGWHVGVEDPCGGEQPVAVLAVRDAACATSSIRLRRWTLSDGAHVHHLIDPRTGAPGGTGLLSVTVIAPDPAEAEVWSKVLFLHGREGIAEAADRHGLRALWISEDGAVAASASAAQHLVWLAS